MRPVITNPHKTRQQIQIPVQVTRMIPAHKMMHQATVTLILKTVYLMKKMMIRIQRMMTARRQIVKIPMVQTMKIQIRNQKTIPQTPMMHNPTSQMLQMKSKVLKIRAMKGTRCLQGHPVKTRRMIYQKTTQKVCQTVLVKKSPMLTSRTTPVQKFRRALKWAAWSNRMKVKKIRLVNPKIQKAMTVTAKVENFRMPAVAAERMLQVIKPETLSVMLRAMPLEMQRVVRHQVERASLKMQYPRLKMVQKRTWQKRVRILPEIS